MTTTTHIKFGDGLAVTDEGSGVIRVDSGGGSGGGIQFDTSPQEGGFLEVGTPTGDITLDAGSDIVLKCNDTTFGYSRIQMGLGASGVEIRAGGPGGLLFELHDASGQLIVKNNSDVELFRVDQDGGVKLPHLSTSDPASVGEVWNDGGTVVFSGSTAAGGAGTSAKVDRDAVETATARLVAVKLAAGDTQPAFRILGDGKHVWGQGGTTAPDTNLYRAAGGILRTDQNLHVIGTLVADSGGAGNPLNFGGGTDAQLTRPAAGVLKTNTTFVANTQLVGQGTAYQVWFGNRGPAGEAGFSFGTLEDVIVYRAGVGQLKTNSEITCWVTGVGSRLIVAGAADSGGAGYRILRIAN